MRWEAVVLPKVSRLENLTRRLLIKWLWRIVMDRDVLRRRGKT